MVPPIFIFQNIILLKIVNTRILSLKQSGKKREKKGKMKKVERYKFFGFFPSNDATVLL